MSAATKTRTTTTDHSPEVRALLKKGRLSEGTELDEATTKALLDLPDSANEAMIHSIVTGKAANGNGNGGKKGGGKRKQYPEAVRKVYEAALALTGKPADGGPKVPLSPKQVEAVKKALSAKGKAVAEANAAIEGVSPAQLKKIAKGQDASKEATAAVRGFLKAHEPLKVDKTMYARKGAAIVLALREAE